MKRPLRNRPLTRNSIKKQGGFLASAGVLFLMVASELHAIPMAYYPQR